METDSSNKEQRILRVMRKVLGSIVRDTTPRSGMRNPLKDATIQDIRACFALISARERELAEATGISLDDRPRYPDQKPGPTVVQFKNIGKSAAPLDHHKDDSTDE